MSNRRVTFLTLALALASTAANAQNDTNNWIFAYHAGLNFGNVPYTGVPSINSVDACSSISDAAGNLLFYTDGQRVWNSHHALMPAVNTVATQLHGDMNASQAALIVPRPQSGCNEYYIITTETAFNSHINHTLRYSVVQMNASTGGGLGDVTVKDVPLQNDMSEQLTATANGPAEYWFVSHGAGLLSGSTNNAQFLAWHVTASGINPIPVPSSGHPHVEGYDPAISNYYPRGWSATGQMKFSQKGDRLAIAVPSKYVEVCDFAKSSGQVTGCPILFNLDLASGPHAPFLNSLVFGIEFSPNGQYLYVSTYGDGNLFVPKGFCQLIQFDLLNPGNPGLVIDTSSSVNVITNKPNADMGELQLASDGSIYLARTNKGYLSAVTLPDNACPTPSSCGFVKISKSLNSSWGLPNMVQGAFTCASSSACPPNTTATTINGVTFCCSTRTTETGQTCCKRLCPTGTTESTVNGTTLCCSAEGGSAIGSETSKVCCTKP